LQTITKPRRFFSAQTKGKDDAPGLSMTEKTDEMYKALVAQDFSQSQIEALSAIEASLAIFKKLGPDDKQELRNLVDQFDSGQIEVDTDAESIREHDRSSSHVRDEAKEDFLSTQREDRKGEFDPNKDMNDDDQFYELLERTNPQGVETVVGAFRTATVANEELKKHQSQATGRKGTEGVEYRVQARRK
jgi:hypothetical protein